MEKNQPIAGPQDLNDSSPKPDVASGQHPLAAPAPAPAPAPIVTARVPVVVQAPSSGDAPDITDERRVLNPSAMLKRRNLLTLLFTWLTFRKVTFDDRHVRTVRDLQRDGDVVFVMNHLSTLDALYFNWAFLKLDLPLAWVTDRISWTRFQPLWRILVHGLRRVTGYYKHRLTRSALVTYALSQGRPALLFLKSSSWWPWSTAESNDNELLETVLRAQLRRTSETAGGTPSRPLHVVPQLLIWHPHPDRYRRGTGATVFGNPQPPGRARKFLNFILNRRRAFVQMGQPIDLAEFIAANSDLNAPGDVKDLARSLRFAIQRAVSLEEKVVKGPALKRAKQLRAEILESQRMQDAIKNVSAKTGQSEKSLNKEVDGYLKEMAADFSISAIEIMCMGLAVLFSRIYKEVVLDMPGLEKVREAGRKGPLVLLPCHRSHVDYLVISYLFHINGLIAPHIAAGKNLNFFPIGGLFRRCGAFFMRRSFKDNPAYAHSFGEYMRKLVVDGYWTEFFIEGGRSRTGKMLPPRFGLLKHVVETVRSRAAEDAYLVPIYVGYEQVIEEGSFTRELSGGKKKKENITQLLSATQVLWAKYGRLYVNIGDPISCREAMDSAGIDEHTPQAEADELLQRLGYRVSDGINAVAMVTPSALVSTALLVHPKRGITRDTLRRRVGFLLELAQLKDARLSKTLEHALRLHRQEIVTAREEAGDAPLLASGEQSPLARALGLAAAEAIDEVIGSFTKAKHLETVEFEDEHVYALRADHRINLEFYKNNIVHLFVSEAIVAAAIEATRQGQSTTFSNVTAAAAFLSRTFKYEFVFDPQRGFAGQFGDTLLRFEEGGLITRTPGEDFSQLKITVTPLGEGTMALLHRILLPWVEAYLLLAIGLDRQGAEPVDEKTFVKRCQIDARRRFHVGDISCPESASSVNYKHALNAYEGFGLLSRGRKGRDKLITGCQADDDQRFAELATELRRFLVT